MIPETRYARLADLHYAYQVVGHGPPDILLLDHIAVRVLAEAGASEILVSSTVKDLVVGSGLAFDDRGLRDLKGVPGSWHLFAVPR